MLKDLKEHFFILFIVSMVFSMNRLFTFLFTKKLAGLDLVGNFPMVWLMQDYLASLSLSGWTNLWFGGMPVFTFYPPLFFVVVCLFHNLSLGTISLLDSYKVIIFLSVFLFPSTVYYSLRMMGFNKTKSLFCALWVFYFLLAGGNYSAVHQTLNLGLVVQMFSLNVFMLFIGFLFKSYTKDKTGNNLMKTMTPGLLLGFIILSHPYVAILTFISLVLFLLLDYKKEKVSYVGFILLIGFLISSVWWVPLLMNIQFSRMYGWKPVSIKSFPPVLLFFSIFIVLGNKKIGREEIFISLMFLVVVLIGTCGFPFHPIQYDRFFFYSIMFASIIAGIGYYNIYSFFLGKLGCEKGLITIFITSLLFFVILHPTPNVWGSVLQLDELNEWIKKNVKDGRILTESDRMLGGDYYTLMSNIPIESGVPVLNQLHVDSMSGSYTLALQHEISTFPKEIQVCELCHERMNKSRELIISQMRKFNVKYVIATSNSTKMFLGKFLKSVYTTDKFSIFETPIHSSYCEILKYKPILVISELRGSEYSWEELNKIAFTNPELENVTFVWSRDVKDINFDDFGAVILLKEVRIEANIPVYTPREGEKLKDFIHRIERKLYIKNRVNGTIKNLEFSDDVIKLSVESENKVPILLKFTYFPKWSCSERVYLASPSLMLIHGKGDIKLSYDTKMERLLFFTSLSFLFVLIVLKFFGNNIFIRNN